jgi:hypothetical protein
MRKSLLTTVAALASLSAMGAIPAAAQTLGQTYAIGPSDFDPGYAETRRGERRWASDPAVYGHQDRYRRPVRSGIIECESFAFRDRPRCFVR